MTDPKEQSMSEQEKTPVTDPKEQSMSEQEKTPETHPIAAQKEVAAQKEESSGNLLSVAMASVALCLGGYAFYQTQFGQVQPAAGFYVVDSDRLAAAYIGEAMLKGRDQDPILLQQQLEQNMNQIRSKLQNMADSGMVVMQRSAVLTYPPSADLTEKIAADLGVNLSLVPNMPAPTATATATTATAPLSGSSQEAAGDDAGLD